jgi:uncharacterized RDD family membrane protein YckC
MIKKRGVNIWRRISAFLIDQGIIFLIIVFPFNNFFENNSFLENIDTSLFLAYFIIIILSLLYWIVLEFLFKQTAGKAILGIFVNSNEKETTLWQIIVRNIPKVSLLLIFFDSIPILFRKEQQRYFEKLSRTEVTYEK